MMQKKRKCENQMELYTYSLREMKKIKLFCAL